MVALFFVLCKPKNHIINFLFPRRATRIYTAHMRMELLKHLTTFIAFKTVGSDTDVKRKCLDWIQENFFSDTHLPMYRGEVQGAPYLLLSHPQPSLMWFAHVDVVPGSESQFDLRVDDDLAFGRGAKDMKGATLALLMAYRSFAMEHGIAPPLSILLTSDEEVGGETIPALFRHGMLKDIPVGYTPDSGSQPFIVTEHKGVLWAGLTARGRGGHGSVPWDCENPIPLLAQAIEVLTKEFPPVAEEEWRMTVAPTQMQGSAAPNQIPDTATATLDIRFPKSVCATSLEALERVRQVLPEGCEARSVRAADPLYTDPNHPMVQTVKRIAEEVLGHAVELGREHGASDARYFDAHGVPAFIYGPRGDGLHSADEWVSIASLMQHVEINRRILSAL